MPELTIEADPAEVGLDAEPSLHSGGGGLVSTAADYDRFTQLLLHRPGSPAGELDGVRLLSPHGPLHDPQPPAGRPGPGDLRPAAVRRGPVPRGRLRPRLRRPARPGARQGDRLAGPDRVVFTQLLPSSTYPIRPRLRQLVYQALTD